MNTYRQSEIEAVLERHMTQARAFVKMTELEQNERWKLVLSLLEELRGDIGRLQVIDAIMGKRGDDFFYEQYRGDIQPPNAVQQWKMRMQHARESVYTRNLCQGCHLIHVPAGRACVLCGTEMEKPSE